MPDFPCTQLFCTFAPKKLFQVRQETDHEAGCWKSETTKNKQLLYEKKSPAKKKVHKCFSLIYAHGSLDTAHILIWIKSLREALLQRQSLGRVYYFDFLNGRILQLLADNVSYKKFKHRFYVEIWILLRLLLLAKYVNGISTWTLRSIIMKPN